MYAHMSRYGAIEQGIPVHAGDVIGYVGMTGLSTGYHLHYEYQVDGSPRDPNIIIAPLKGHEFRKACTEVGGQFIRFGSGSSDCINFMEIQKIDTTISELLDGEYNESRLAQQIEDVKVLYSIFMPEMTNVEEQYLDDALIKTYERFGMNLDNQSLYDPDRPGEYKKMPIPSDLYKTLQEEQGARRLAIITKQFVTGSARSFNHATNVDLNNKYTVLDVSNLKGKMLTASMYITLKYLKDKLTEDRTKNKVIIIDEDWYLIGSGGNTLTANFVLELVKTIRGLGGGVITATQDIADHFSLEGGKYGKGILSNSRIKVLFNMEASEAAYVAEFLNLTPTEEQSIRVAERGQGLLSTNSNNVSFYFVASELEEELITTDPAALRRIAEKKRSQKESSLKI